MNTELDLLRRWLTEPGGGMISRPLARAAFGEILQEIDRLAGLRTDAEIQDGMSGDDAAQAMGEVIEWARRHSAVRPLPHCTAGMAMQIDASMPDDTIAIVAPGAAPFFIVNMGPAAPNCRVCNGTGEVIEYPADEDERIVACSACGGTGEATAI